MNNVALIETLENNRSTSLLQFRYSMNTIVQSQWKKHYTIDVFVY